MTPPFFLPYKTKNPRPERDEDPLVSLIHISHLTFQYDGGSERIFDDVSFQLDTDWKLGFTGRNGRGKTTFFKLLMGEYEYRGTLSASVKFAYFPYEVTDREDTALQVAETAAGGRAEPWEVLRELTLLQVPDEALYRPFSDVYKRQGSRRPQRRSGSASTTCPAPESDTETGPL